MATREGPQGPPSAGPPEPGGPAPVPEAGQPPDPRRTLADAEAAHLAARTTVPITTGGRSGPEESPARGSTAGAAASGRADAAGVATRETVRLDRPTVRLDQPTAPRRPGGPDRSRASGRRGAPLPVAAAVAAVLAAVVSFLPVAAVVQLLVTAEVGPSGVAPVRVAVAAWLLGHGVPLATPDGPVSVPPLALSVLAAWRVARAGVHTTRAIGSRGRRSLRQALLAAVAVAVAYGGVGAFAGWLAGGTGWGASPVRAAVTLAGFGLVAAGYGTLRATGLLGHWFDRSGATPAVGLAALLPVGIRAGLLAATVSLAAGAALAGAAVAAGGAAATDVLAAYRTGVIGQAGITLVCLAFAPNLAAWSTAYLLGPGFAVGVHTVVRSSEVDVGLLPVLPVFAGLPEGPLPTLGALLLLVPVAAGVVSGARLARWVAGWWWRLVAVVVTGGVAGLTLGLTAMVSGGALGDGQLAVVGPAPLPVAGAGALTVAVGGLLGVLLFPRRSGDAGTRAG